MSDEIPQPVQQSGTNLNVQDSQPNKSGWLRISLIILYSLSILLLIFLLIIFSLPPVNCPPELGWGCLGYGFVLISSYNLIALFSSLLVMQAPVLLALIFKKEWFIEHISFKFISFLLIIPSIIIAIALLGLFV